MSWAVPATLVVRAIDGQLLRGAEAKALLKNPEAWTHAWRCLKPNGDCHAPNGITCDCAKKETT